MKKVKLDVLEFKKQSIINLNSDQMVRVNGGTNPLATDVSIFDITTNPVHNPIPVDPESGSKDNNPVTSLPTQTGPMSVMSKFCLPPPPNGL